MSIVKLTCVTGVEEDKWKMQNTQNYSEVMFPGGDDT